MEGVVYVDGACEGCVNMQKEINQVGRGDIKDISVRAMHGVSVVKRELKKKKRDELRLTKIRQTQTAACDDRQRHWVLSR